MTIKKIKETILIEKEITNEFITCDECKEEIGYRLVRGTDYVRDVNVSYHWCSWCGKCYCNRCAVRIGFEYDNSQFSRHYPENGRCKEHIDRHI